MSDHQDIEIRSSRILVVDDEFSVQKLLRRFLEEAGYRVHTTESVASAKLELKQHSFDLILLDLEMPGESGLDLLRYSKVQYPQTGCVMVTSSSDSEKAKEILDIGVYGYILKPFTKSTLIITIDNALRHLRLDLEMLASKTTLEKEMWGRTEKLAAIIDNLNAGVIMVNPDLQIIELNQQMQEWFPDAKTLSTKKCYQQIGCSDTESPCKGCPMDVLFQTGKTYETENKLLTEQGKRDFHITASPIHDESGEIIAGVGMYQDITEITLIEQELRQAQKIEAIGQLAAGITHEINTPVQYVGFNLSFLKDAFNDVTTVLDAYHSFYNTVKTDKTVPDNICKDVESAIETADLEYLIEEIPATISQAMEGTQRVEKIVQAMKEFSHPGSDDKVAININQLIESTVTLSRNQWKYVAELETDLQENLPLVPCFPGEINQVFLNIIVNAAHAIEGTNPGEKKGLGKIKISTHQKSNSVQVLINDTGGGIPASIQSQIFDSFFTTKDIGKGTGQGLAIARRVIIEKHQGTITFESIQDEGTTFIIDLPSDNP